MTDHRANFHESTRLDFLEVNGANLVELTCAF